MAAIRKLLAIGKDGHPEGSVRARLLARAATLIEPDAKARQGCARTDLGHACRRATTEAAARWIPAIGRMDDADADRCWAMVALAAPDIADVGTGRLNGFIRRDKSRGRVRSALLVAGLAGLGRISTDTGEFAQPPLRPGPQPPVELDQDDRCGRRPGPGGDGAGADRHRASRRRSFERLPAAHMYHAITSLERTGQDFTARMIAAEALSRT